MMSSFQSRVGASFWTMAVLDILVISYVIWLIYRVFALTGAALHNDDKQRAGNRSQAIQPPVEANNR